MSSTELRQAVGKVDIGATQLVYGEWKVLEVAPELPPTSRYGVSHGNGSMFPPKAVAGGMDGLFGWRPSDDQGVIHWMMWYDKGTTSGFRFPYLHSFNLYLGRSVENNEPWLASGNSVKFRVARAHRNFNTLIETEVVYAPIDSEEETQMIGPFNFNLEDILWQKGEYSVTDFLTVSLKLEGPNTTQQEDVCVLGGRSGFWAIETTAPIFRWGGYP